MVPNRLKRITRITVEDRRFLKKSMPNGNLHTLQHIARYRSNVSLAPVSPTNMPELAGEGHPGPSLHSAWHVQVHLNQIGFRSVEKPAVWQVDRLRYTLQQGSITCFHLKKPPQTYTTERVPAYRRTYLTYSVRSATNRQRKWWVSVDRRR